MLVLVLVVFVVVVVLLDVVLPVVVGAVCCSRRSEFAWQNFFNSAQCDVLWFLFAGDEDLYHRVPSNYVARTTARPEENPEVPFRIMAPSADPSCMVLSKSISNINTDQTYNF